MATPPPQTRRSTMQRVGLVLGPICFALLLAADLQPGRPQVTRMASVAVLMAVLWVTEAIPLAATAILPLVLYPLLGLMKGAAVAPVFVNSTIFLFIGGFIIALGMEQCGLHRRIALRTIGLTGSGPSTIILGFMLASALLSMWISNTATAVMMLPIGMSMISQLEHHFDPEQAHPFSAALMLGIAYAASIGGAATLVGTPPNLAFARIFSQTFPDGPSIGFGSWMAMALPISAVMLAVAWLLLTRVFYRVSAQVRVERRLIDDAYRALGRISFEELALLVVFATTATLWIFRQDLRLGSLVVPGWSRLLPFPRLLDDGTVAMLMALLLFVIPTRSPAAPGRTLVDATVFGKLPWNIVLLFGGGFALAEGFKVTGLSSYIGGRLEGLAGTSTVVTLLVVCTTLTFLTEFTSNTATTQMILPILASVARALGTDPLLLMIPATLSASCAFMMPVATPPNAIVFGSGRIRIREMARVGLVLNLVGVVVIATLFYLLGTAVFAIDPATLPSWAAN